MFVCFLILVCLEFKPTSAQEDTTVLLSIGKPTNQSSTLLGHHSDFATDGTEYNNGTETCSTTEGNISKTEVRIGLSNNFQNNPICDIIEADDKALMPLRLHIECDYTLFGRYISIQIINTTESLQLCDVRAYGFVRSQNSSCSYSPGPCGDVTCKIAENSSCDCNESSFKCNNGRCVRAEYTCNAYDNCGDGSDEQFLCDPIILPDNIITDQSSTYIDKGNNGYVASFAVDGNFRPHVSTCTHSRMEYEPWWMLDLGKQYDIRYVDIVNRERFEYRLNGAVVGIGMSRKPKVNPRCGPIINDSMTSIGYKLRLDCTYFLHGRFVTVQLMGIREYLTLCEISLFGYEYRVHDEDISICSYSPGPCDTGQCSVLPSISCNCIDSSFECENGRCIPDTLRCNNYDNCGDASDEIDCSCGSSELSCNGLCVPERWLCDGFTSCDNGEDELYCYCGVGNFQCSNGRCIEAVKVCDLNDDCGTNEDEEGCIICPDGVNVPASRVCDGTYDCADRIDETSCESCPEGWELWQHSCYYILRDTNRTFSQAEQKCSDIGGSIVLVESEQENSFVFKILQDFGLLSTWIGFTDREEEGVWKHIAPTFTSYENWDRDEPSNDKDEHCAIINTNLNGHWKDMVCWWIRIAVCEFRPVRIVSSDLPTEGVVELFYNNIWGSICSDNFGKNEADVVCRQLGMAYAQPLKCCSETQQRPNALRLYSSITCKGNEDSLGECTKIIGNGCNDDTETYIKCNKEGIRLSNGEGVHEGFVEVFLNDVWGTYCDINIDQFAANLICKGLGYHHVTGFTNQADAGKLWSGTPINIRDIDCTGRELSIFECTESDNVLCQHDHDVYVTCNTECSQETIVNQVNVSFGSPVEVDIILEPCTVMSWVADGLTDSHIKLDINEISIMGMDSAQTCIGYFTISEPDQESNIGPLCGDVIPYIRSTTSKLTLSLGAGYRRQHIILKALFTNVEIPGCVIHGLSSSASCNHPFGIFATFNYPHHYIGGSRYTWEITAPSQSHYILLTFSDFDVPDLQNCENDYVTVNTDVNSHSESNLEPYCNGMLPPENIKSSRHKMVITFVSDYSNNGRGFVAEYNSYRFSRAYNISQSTEKCPDNWVKYSTSCYTFRTESDHVTWTEAEQICQNEDAHLVSIKDVDEMMFLHLMLTTDWITQNYITYIGLSHWQNNLFAVYTWSDGSPLKEDLNSRQPLGGNLEECTVIIMKTLHSVNQWVEVPCEYPSTNQMICKKQESGYEANKVINQPLDIILNQACDANEFECENGECIHEIYQCDGNNDCIDNTDEQHCSGICDSSKFQCDINTCISLSFRCDFVQHCMDGADEINCIYRNCSTEEFQCGNGECIRRDMRCDLIPQCIDGSDEIECTGCDFGFQCYDGACIPLRLNCDGTKDCPGSIMEDEQFCSYWNQSSCSLDELRCKNGECAPMSSLCVYDKNSQKLPTGCRDSSNLENCTDVVCPRGTVKCPGSYCIAKHLQCNTLWDCPNGEDEIQCESHECPGMFRCHKSQVCILHSQKCNGVTECPEADDEMYCNLTCPVGCTCVGLTVTCQSLVWDMLVASRVPNSSRFISISNIQHNRVRRSAALLTVEDILQMELKNFQLVISLNISSNGIKKITASTFIDQVNLETLVLSGNEIEYMEAGCFNGLKRLTTLYIDNNGLVKVGPGVFIDAPMLQTIHIENNHLEDIDPDMFAGLDLLKNLYTDDFQFCCMVSETTHCEPPPGIFSSCEDLMRISFLRIAMWILGLSALVGNAFVVVWRVQDKFFCNVQSFLITNLAISDFLMGVYMVIIASADVHFRGEYAVYATIWRSSFLCHFAGALSMTSSEFSVFTLVIISIDRAISVGFPFSDLKITRKKCYIIVTFGWIIAVLFGFLPNMGIAYFGDNFYGRPSVCLALPLTAERLSGWEYSVAIVLGLNLLSFLIIAISYIYMFVVVKETAASANKNVSNYSEIKMASKMAMIIFTDFCCWFPIILMGIAAQAGSWKIPVDVYVWSATLILPINASLNPYLYTILWINDKKKCKKMSSLQLTTFSSTHSTGNDKPFAVVFDSECQMSTGKNGLRPHQIKDVELELNRTLQLMHSRNIYHGDVTEKNIIIYEEKGRIHTFLITKNALCGTDEKQNLISRDFKQLETFLNVLKSGIHKDIK